jgi:acyl carrier protein
VETAAQNEQRLKQVFARALGLRQESITNDLSYGNVAEWDSIAHMALIAAIDQTFSIMLETNDVIDMSSFGKAKELLAKYDLVFE